MTSTSLPQPPPNTHDVDERICLDAARHPERTPTEHIRAAERIASESYRAELRKLVSLDMLEPDER